MVSVFQGETGGRLSFSIPTSITTAVSGYLDVVGKQRRLYRFDGIITSGNLYIAKSGISNLSPGDYVMLPQVIDPDIKVYFLDSDDLQIIEVPDFFSYAVLTNGDSVLARLNALENAQGYTYYTAGPAGIQTAKLVALVDNVVYHADCTNINHAGKLVGISVESASPGDQVKVQGSDIFSSSLLSFISTGSAIVGKNGAIVTTVPGDAVFIQFAGVIVGPNKVALFVDPDSYII